MRDILEINDQVRRVKEKSSLSIFLKILPDIGFWYSHHVHTWTSLSTDHHDTMIRIHWGITIHLHGISFFADFFQVTDLVLFAARSPAGCLGITLSPRRNESSRTSAICTASWRVAEAERYPGAAAAVMSPAPGGVWVSQ